MHLLFETPAGYALFKIKKGSQDATNVLNLQEQISSNFKLKAFAPFESTADAVVATTNLIESNLDKGLKKFLKKNISSKDSSDELAVADHKLGGLIKEALDIKCVSGDAVLEFFRTIREHLGVLLKDSDGEGLKSMQLGLSHSLSRYKLKFSADKVDIMIVQAIGLLDDLDKEINIYAMRVREWYGWHFPEMSKIINDNVMYAKCVVRMGFRTDAKNNDFSDIIADDSLENSLKKTAETSMGTEIAESDLDNIRSLCNQVISLSEYRIQLFEYLKNRMTAIAPNLTLMVGELVGARLIAHSGSLINLAKHPASTIQILGAEKALFRALKTKSDTPKYGLIYHASLIGQAAPKIKGKVSRVLAAKTALAIRVDALGDSEGPTIGYENRIKVEARIRQLEGGHKVLAANNQAAFQPSKYDRTSFGSSPPSYNESSDIVLQGSVKRKREDEGEASEKKRKTEPEEIEKDSKTEKKEKKEKKAKKSKE
jgi:nucleolar protein 58